MTNARLSDQIVLVTGASGFIGGALCRRLLDKGAEVHAVSRTDRAGGASRWWKSDLGDHSQVKKLIAAVRPQVIYHLAGQSSAARDLAMRSFARYTGVGLSFTGVFMTMEFA